MNGPRLFLKAGLTVVVWGLAAGLISCPCALAEQTQVDHIEYFPIDKGLPDPFHVVRLTVGSTYSAVDPPTDSAAVAGFVGVKTTSPSMPLTVGPRNGTNLGGALRLLGAGANGNAYFANNSNAMTVFSGATGSETEKIRIMEIAGFGIYKNSTGLRNPVGELEIGPRDATNSGAQVLWAGAVNGAGADHPYFYIENDTGKMRLFALNVATTTNQERLRVLNNGSMGIFLDPAAGVNAVEDPRAPLEIARSTTNGGRIRFLGSGTNRYFSMSNESTTRFQIAFQPGAIPFRLRMSDGMAAVGGLSPIPANNTRLLVNSGNANFMTNNVGVRTASPRALLHVNDSNDGTRFYDEGLGAGPQTFTGSMLTVRPSGNTPTYAFFASGPALGVGKGSVPAYIEIESGKVGIHASAVRDIGGAPYPSSLSMVIKTSNQKGTSLFQGAVYMAGAVFGVDDGSVPSSYMVKVFGAAEATAWSPAPSTAHLKTNIVPLTCAEEQVILGKLVQTPLYHYRLKKADYAKADRLGFLVEEAPLEILDDSGKGVVRSDALAAILAAVKSQQLEIESLKAELKQLEK